MRTFGTIALIFAVGQLGHSAILADSVADFSGTQGLHNWFYGYYNKSIDTPPYTYNHLTKFQLMNKYEVTHALSGFTSSAAWGVNTGAGNAPVWTALWNDGGHGNGNNTSGGRQMVEHFPVRRWVSKYTGSVNITGVFAKIDGSGGNGSAFYLRKNSVDVQIAPYYVGNADTIGFKYSTTLNITAGDVMDLFLDPWQADDLSDSTRLTMRVETVPEPHSALVLSALLCGMAVLTLRKRSVKILGALFPDHSLNSSSKVMLTACSVMIGTNCFAWLTSVSGSSQSNSDYNSFNFQDASPSLYISLPTLWRARQVSAIAGTGVFASLRRCEVASNASSSVFTEGWLSKASASGVASTFDELTIEPAGLQSGEMVVLQFDGVFRASRDEASWLNDAGGTSTGSASITFGPNNTSYLNVFPFSIDEDGAYGATDPTRQIYARVGDKLVVYLRSSVYASSGTGLRIGQHVTSCSVSVEVRVSAVTDGITLVSDSGTDYGFGGKLVSGRVALEDFMASPTDQTVTVALYDSNGVQQSAVPALLDAQGKFEFVSYQLGNFTARMKGIHWLSEAVPVTISKENAPYIEATLPNGDVNGDNYIGTDDYLRINGAFDSSKGDVAYDPAADLNGDGYVGTDDYIIVNKNFDRSGN